MLTNCKAVSQTQAELLILKAVIRTYKRFLFSNPVRALNPLKYVPLVMFLENDLFRSIRMPSSFVHHISIPQSISTCCTTYTVSSSAS